MNVTVRSLWVVFLAATTACTTHRNAHIAPVGDVDMDAKVLAKFQHEIQEYMELHQELVHRIPNVGQNASAKEIAAHRAKMAKGIQEERKSAKQGDILRPSVESAFRRIIDGVLAGPDRASVVKEIKQGNPTSENVPNQANPTREHTESVLVAVNAAYNDDAPFSSVPSTLLVKLPPLPSQVQYQFVGRDLILRDTEANVILDFIKEAVPDRSIPR